MESVFSKQTSPIPTFGVSTKSISWSGHTTLLYCFLVSAKVSSMSKKMSQYRERSSFSALPLCSSLNSWG